MVINVARTVSIAIRMSVSMALHHYYRYILLYVQQMNHELRTRAAPMVTDPFG